MKRIISIIVLNALFISFEICSSEAQKAWNQIFKKLDRERTALENYLVYQAVDQAVKRGISGEQIKGRIQQIDQLRNQMQSGVKLNPEDIKNSEATRPLITMPEL